MKLYLTLAMCAVPVLSLPFNFTGRSSTVSTMPAKTTSCSSNVVPIVGGGALLVVLLSALACYYYGYWPFSKTEDKKEAKKMSDLLKLDTKNVVESDHDNFKHLLNDDNDDITKLTANEQTKFQAIKAALEAKAPAAA